MSAVAIHVENLGKRYHIGRAQQQHDTVRDALAAALRAPLARVRRTRDQALATRNSTDTIWALRHVTFEVERGSVVGVIGRNGAGKSTLLKILTRITEPSEGRALLNGRVGSLLEVGTGFHPELTGRENVYLSGAILGMRREEIERKFDEIVAFSGVAKFIDTPIKHYSSGMNVRLGFAVAAHLEPEILLIDEVLAVGDAEFQKRCLGKMEQVARQGRTVLFVSHNMGAIRSLTAQCLYLSDGQIRAQGHTDTVVQQYLDEVFGQPDQGKPELRAYRRDSVAESPVRLKRIWLSGHEDVIPALEMGEELRILAQLESDMEIRGAYLAVGLRKRDGTSVTVALSVDQGFRLDLPLGTHTVECVIRGLPLAPGDYSVDMGVNQSAGTRAWDVILNYPLFRVVDRAGQVVHWIERPWGAVHWSDISWGLVDS